MRDNRVWYNHQFLWYVERETGGLIGEIWLTEISLDFVIITCNLEIHRHIFIMKITWINRQKYLAIRIFKITGIRTSWLHYSWITINQYLTILYVTLDRYAHVYKIKYYKLLQHLNYHLYNIWIIVTSAGSSCSCQTYPSFRLYR